MSVRIDGVADVGSCFFRSKWWRFRDRSNTVCADKDWFLTCYGATWT